MIAAPEQLKRAGGPEDAGPAGALSLIRIVLFVVVFDDRYDMVCEKVVGVAVVR